MNWTASVDIYCERMGPEFWAEPINAISNAAFILASLWAGYTARKQAVTTPIIWVLIVLAFCIGTGSFLFHTYAQTWAGLADTIPIWTFVATYIIACIMLLGGVAPKKIVMFGLLGVALLIVFTIAFDSPDTAAPRTPSRFNGSEQYAPAVIAMIFFSALTLWRGHPIRYWFLAATLTFLVSLGFRTVDNAFCTALPHGTHFLWHLLNGTMIALLLQALIRHMPSKPA